MTLTFLSGCGDPSSLTCQAIIDLGLPGQHLCSADTTGDKAKINGELFSVCSRCFEVVENAKGELEKRRNLFDATP